MEVFVFLVVNYMDYYFLSKNRLKDFAINIVNCLSLNDFYL
jgi:hypothetical protein